MLPSRFCFYSFHCSHRNQKKKKERKKQILTSRANYYKDLQMKAFAFSEWVLS